MISVKYSFLSCLFGSEANADKAVFIAVFLSCLFGSEECIEMQKAIASFLSCLFGSEGYSGKLHRFNNFLSCLFGSEVEHLSTKILIFKELLVLLLIYPFFKAKMQPLSCKGCS
tara:strand:- start:1499 stop:1840 length:342 start_codon:yes stop_codon:yes gene_type:complete